MKTILLCAGFATRLYPLTKNFPKPLLSVAGRPILSDLVERLAATGHVDEFIVVSNGRFHQKFVDWAGGARELVGNARISVLNDGVLNEKTRLGAVGDLAFAVRERNIQEPVLVAAGDNLFRFPFASLFEDYFANPRTLTVIHPEADRARLQRTGVAEIGEQGRLIKLWEKPAEPPTHFACPPIYLLQPEALTLLPAFIESNPAADAPGNFIAWLADHMPVFTHAMNGERLDVGDLHSYRAAEAWLLEHGDHSC